MSDTLPEAGAAELDRINDEFRRIEESLRQHTRALAQLNRLGQELTAMLDLQQIAGLLSRVATDIINTESVSVWLLDERIAGELVCWTSSDHVLYDSEHSPVNLRLPSGQGIAGWVVQKGESVVVQDVRSDPRFFSGIEEQIDFRTHSLLAVPLRARNTIIGVLEALNKLAGEFTAEDMTLAETLAASAAIAMTMPVWSKRCAVIRLTWKCATPNWTRSRTRWPTTSRIP